MTTEENKNSLELTKSVFLFIGYNFSRADLDLNNHNKSALTLHRIIEAFKFGFARRSDLADPAFEPNVTEVYEKIKIL